MKKYIFINKNVNRSIFDFNTTSSFLREESILSEQKDIILISDTGIRYSTQNEKKNENSLRLWHQTSRII